MNICLYGASSSDIDDAYIKAVEKLGSEMASRGHDMIFGGGAHGLMGAAARGVDSKGRKIIGVAPSFFNIDGVLYEKCTEFVYTETMRERKQVMEDRADAFIVTPGGVGTFEEFFEIFTLKQLGRHNKAIVLYNINGYFDDIQKLIGRAVSEHFMKPDNEKLCVFLDDISEILDYIENYDDSQMDVEQLRFTDKISYRFNNEK